MGWFSFLHGEATAGDLDAARTVSGWLTGAGVAHDLAWSPAFGRSPTLEEADPGRYDRLVFACGPAGGIPVAELLDRYRHCRTVAVGVSAVDRELLGRFDAALPRDGAGSPTVDLAATGDPGDRWPVVAVVRANPQPEYGERARHEPVHRAIDAALAAAPVAVVEVDTRVDPRAWRQRSTAQCHGLLAAADAVVSTRLHGLVLGLRAGTPVLAVDPIAGGAKVRAQAEALGWPLVLDADGLTPADVTAGLARSLSPGAGAAVAEAQDRAATGLVELRRRFLAAMER